MMWRRGLTWYNETLQSPFERSPVLDEEGWKRPRLEALYQVLPSAWMELTEGRRRYAGCWT